eukprot:CAMPEP_0174707020 /NCGR_PEP_ID=MMETSP1094-20130205/9661_1 /TAXON_ID=156173 /ORGANISM="Chrysochromulina brevifilum, Strain UTEX LB 985" /LENGTH=68 /DNA_ID=CAMNT_0015905355 /DNA_START=1188 /DNA_END=1391 /DNA_ORIENTATION=-
MSEEKVATSSPTCSFDLDSVILRSGAEGSDTRDDGTSGTGDVPVLLRFISPSPLLSGVLAPLDNSACF